MRDRLLRLLTTFAALLTLGVLLALAAYILIRGIPCLRPSLFSPVYTSENVSLLPALINTLTVTALSLLFALPAGVGAAIYLGEYARRGSRLAAVVRLAAETLQGIPSILYGLFGYLLWGLRLGWGFSILGGALTLAVMILPVILRTTEEALRSVPDSWRESCLGLGAGRLRTITRVVLPAAAPGILAGAILSVGRVVGETAALLYPAGTATGVAESLFSSGRTLSIHMYALLSEGLHTDAAYATAVVLLVLVAGINTLSAILARRAVRRRWS